MKTTAPEVLKYSWTFVLFHFAGGKNSGSNKTASIAVRISAGITTGGLAVLFAQPTDVVKVRMQAQRSGSSGSRYTGTMNAYTTIGRMEGLAGLWKGIWSYHATGSTWLNAENPSFCGHHRSFPWQLDRECYFASGWLIMRGTRADHTGWVKVKPRLCYIKQFQGRSGLRSVKNKFFITIVF